MKEELQSRGLSIQGVLGQGCQGRVLQVKHNQNGHVYALKMIELGRLGSKEKERIQQQIVLNMQLTQQTSRHYFPAFIQYWFDEQSVYLLFQKCQENAQNGYRRLTNYQQRYNFLVVLLFDMLQALSLLHSANTIHRDIKPQNILIQHGRFKLADLGLSRIISFNKALTKSIGNKLGRSPELITGDYSTQTDIWSLGIHLFYMLEGTLPFDEFSLAFIKNNPNQIDQVVSSAGLSIDFTPHGRKTKNMLSWLHLVLAQMIVVQSSSRKSAIQILQKYYNCTQDNIFMYGLCGYLRQRSLLGRCHLLVMLGWTDFYRMDSRMVKQPQSNKRTIWLRVKNNIWALFSLLRTYLFQFNRNEQCFIQLLAQLLNKWTKQLSSYGINSQVLPLEQIYSIFRIGKVSQKFPLLPFLVKIYQDLLAKKEQSCTLWTIPIQLSKCL